jgi:Polyketide cyclase / dehydrase and lipid transport
MHEVQVNIHINAPIEQVFETISDHQQFLSSADGTVTTLLQEGKSERNGLGCIRQVKVGRRAWYVEEITAWERPIHFEYTIRKASMPIRHEVSRLSFTAANGGTDVQWSSRFSIPIPIVGLFLGAKAVNLYTKAFGALLKAAKAQLERTNV